MKVLSKIWNATKATFQKKEKTEEEILGFKPGPLYASRMKPVPMKPIKKKGFFRK